MLSTLRQHITAALETERSQSLTPPPLVLQSENGAPLILESGVPPNENFAAGIAEGDLDLHVSNVHVHIHEFPAPEGHKRSQGLHDVLQNITLSIRETVHDRDYGWIELKHVRPDDAASVIAELYEAPHSEVISPELLDHVLGSALNAGISFKSNLGANRAAIVHRYRAQLARTAHSDEFDRAERMPAIKILEIHADGSGKRLNWKDGEPYPQAPAHSWKPHLLEQQGELHRGSAALNGERADLETHGPITWIDIEAPTFEKLRLVGEHFKIPARILREGQAHSLGQGFVRHRNHDSISLRILEIGDDRASPSAPLRPHFGEPDELNIILHGDYIITLHERPITAMSDVRRKFETGDTPLESHEGPGAVVATILQECAQENISKLELLEQSLKQFGDAVERKLFGLGELGALYALRKSFKAARDLLKREESMPAELESCTMLFRSTEPQSVCQRYRNKLEAALDKANTHFDDANDYISRNSSRLGARAATGAVAALFVSLSQGYVQALADGAFGPTQGIAGAIMGLGIFGALVAVGRAVRRGQW